MNIRNVIITGALVFFTSALAVCAQNLTVLISFDGFRHDYIQRLPEGPFKQLIAKGCRATSLIPINPTKTFPNHWAIATGLYPEHNGIIDNNFYDRTLADTFRMSRTESVWWRGEPVWITAERNGKHAATYYWPGSQTEIEGRLASTWLPYEPSRNYATRIDTILAWASLPKPPALIVSYFELLDDAGHRYGPDAPQIDTALVRADSIVGALVRGLATRGVLDRTAIVFVSDHGMAQIAPLDPTTTPVDVRSFDESDELTIIESGPNRLVYGLPVSRARSIAANINVAGARVQAWATADMDSTWHIAAPGRCPDLYIQATFPYDLVPTTPQEWKPGPGNHGYHNSNTDMHGIFVASGRGIKPGEIPAMRVVDVYNVVCTLVGVPPARNDGDVRRVKDVIR
jgi:predicted AlkP superfamily pyrophosphatase or phosphodiesterase